MRKTMGKYIDALDADGLDRLLSAQDFSDGAWWDGSCGCLVGTVHDAGSFYDSWTTDEVSHLRYIRMVREHPAAFLWMHETAAWRYPLAVKRFSKERVVRAIKLRAVRRAAQMNGTTAGIIKVATPEEVTV